MENAEVTRVFREYADLLELTNANPFRVRAYLNAARTIDSLTQPLEQLARSPDDGLTELPGIGEDLAGKIREIVRTGSLRAFRQLQKEVPGGLVSLMQLPGLGPKRAQALYKALGIHSLRQLETAARKHRLREVAGFGPRTEERLLHELEQRHTEEHRVLRPVAAQYGEALLGWLRALPGVLRAELAGSYRRCRETVGDLDILVTCRAGTPVIRRFTEYPEVKAVLAAGTTKSSIQLQCGLQADLRVLQEASYGAGLYYFTGSKAHNIAIRHRGQRRGLKINEYGVFKGARRVAGREESEVFKAVGLPWIPPELREDRGEIEAAAGGRLPNLVTLEQIRGDLQSHTTASDGRASLDEMADAAEALGYEYLAVTDHTTAVRVAGGMNRAGFRRQMKKIERLNGGRRALTVLAGAEVDILADGSLDLDEDTRAALDIVVISVHSHLGLSSADQTRRIARAMQQPWVDILGHPTGRLLNQRHGMTLDLEEILRIAAGEGVILEINAQPDRLDLDDVTCRRAIEQHVRLAISTDAHAPSELGFMRWGVDQARRGWATRRSVVNTLPLAQLMKLLHQER